MAALSVRRRRGRRVGESGLVALGCPNVNLQIRTSNLNAVRFHESIGYTMDDVVSMGRRLIDDGVPSTLAD